MLKKNIRTLMLEKRNQYTHAEICEKSNMIRGRLFSNFDFNTINFVHIFFNNCRTNGD